MSTKELASNVLTLVQNLDEYEDMDAQAELLTKIINNALKTE